MTVERVRQAALDYVGTPPNFGENTNLIRVAEEEAFTLFADTWRPWWTATVILALATAYSHESTGYGRDSLDLQRAIQDAAVAGAEWAQGHPKEPCGCDFPDIGHTLTCPLRTEEKK